MATGLDVSVEHEACVVPSLPSPHSTLYLHNIDQQVFFHVEVLFFYNQAPDPQKHHDAENFFQSFYESLAKTLVPYHFAAGRLQVNEKQGRLELLCNRAGALFAGARSSQQMSQLGDLTAANPIFKALFYYGPRVESIDQLPLLTVQVTRFACGGVALGFRASHVVFDGVELYNFFNTYAKIVAGDEEQQLEPLNHDKTYLRPQGPCLAHHEEMASLPDVPARVLFNPDHYIQASNPVPENYIFKTFRFTSELLASLKRRVHQCSAFEALAAHIWQCRTKALELDPESASRLYIPINIRPKLQSSLPCGFAGNCIIAAPCIGVSSRQVCESSLSFCVSKVQETIHNADEKYIRSNISWCEGRHGIVDPQSGIFITTWSKLGFDSIDFGFGKPRYVGILVNPRVEMVTVLSSCVGDGSLDVLMAMPAGKMNKLEKLLMSI